MEQIFLGNDDRRSDPLLVHHLDAVTAPSGEQPSPAPLALTPISPTPNSPLSPNQVISHPSPDLQESSPRVPSERDCREVITKFGDIPGDWNEGEILELSISPMKVKLSRRSIGERVPRQEVHPPRGKVMGISRKSRNQMLKSFSELDFSPMFSTGTGPSLVTLTYPGRWKEVTPTGTTANRHLNLFFLRFERAWGVKPMAFWVREFTEKGAPHFHIYLALPGGLAGEPTRRAYEERLASWQAGECGTRPRWKQPAGFGLTFPEWASRVWAEIVDHPDPAERSKHEKYGVHVARLGSGSEGEPAWMRAYFSKKFSSPKGYQLKVPELWKESAESIGRSWSYRGLKRVGVTAEIPRRASIYIARLLHRKGRHVKVWDPKLQKYTFKPSLQTWRRPRGPIIGYDTGPDGEQRPIRKKRKTKSRRRGMHGNGGAGYHLTHNGPRLADDIHHFLREITKPATPTDKLPPGLRGPVTQRRKTASLPRPAATARRELRDELSP